MRDRGQSGERGSFFAGDGTDLRDFGDQHRAGNWADPRDGAKDDVGLRKAMVTGNGPGDPVFQPLDQVVHPVLQLDVDVLEHRDSAQSLICAGLGQQPFAHFNQLRSFGRQGSEKAYLLCKKTAACFGSECKEAGDKFRIDPVDEFIPTRALREP